MKQYLLVCDETQLAALEAVFKGVRFLEVQGLNVDQSNKVQVLATPVIPALCQAETGIDAATRVSEEMSPQAF